MTGVSDMRFLLVTALVNGKIGKNFTMQPMFSLQVQFQLRAREENVGLDPRLNAQCGPDIHTYCKEESEVKGSGKVSW